MYIMSHHLDGAQCDAVSLAEEKNTEHILFT